MCQIVIGLEPVEGSIGCQFQCCLRCHSCQMGDRSVSHGRQMGVRWAPHRYHVPETSPVLPIVFGHSPNKASGGTSGMPHIRFIHVRLSAVFSWALGWLRISEGCTTQTHTSMLISNTQSQCLVRVVPIAQPSAEVFPCHLTRTMWLCRQPYRIPYSYQIVAT